MLVGQYTTNFSGGQIDLLARQRSDLKLWQNGAASLLNNRPLIEGGLARRPGTRWKATLTSFAEDGMRVFPFVFNLTQRYLVFLVDDEWHVYDTTGAAVDSGTGAPWTTAMLNEIQVAQEGDTMIITHEDMPPQRLLRTGASAFELAELPFTENTEQTVFAQPYYRFDNPNVYITPSKMTLLLLTSVTGTPNGTLTGGTSAATRTFQNLEAITGGTYVWCNGGAGNYTVGEACNYTGGSGTIASILTGQKLTGSSAIFNTTDDKGTIWRMLYSIENAAGDEIVDRWYEQELLDVTSTTVAWSWDRRGLPTWGDIKGTASTESEFFRRQYERMPWWTTTPADADQIATDIWEEPAFSAKRGYPRSVCFHAQRLFFGGHAALPGNFWGSQVGAYFNFDTAEGEDSASLQSAVGSGLGHTIRHLVSHTHLLILTDRGEFYIPQSPTRPLAPDSGALQQATFGSDHVRPVLFDSSILYVQENGRTVRELKYNEISDSYEADAINLIANDCFPSDVSRMGVVYGGDTRHEQYVYCVLHDGTMAVFHGNRAQEIAAWVPWATRSGDSFLDIASIQKDVWVIAKRDINGTPAYYLEQFTDDATMDCEKVWTGASSASITGLGVLNGEVVHALYGTRYHGSFTVSGSAITLEEAVTAVNVGLHFDREITTLPPHIELDGSSLVGEKIRLVKAVLKIADSLTFEVNGYEMEVLPYNFEVGADPDAITAYRTFRFLGWSDEPMVEITQLTPQRFTLLSATIHYRV